ncbi:hypothetical protein BU25DRAFT_457077 [Macroventuria anomochaeta]|uniref:Uncharacterized protein n=1 Tax=Macroventuria anomochaeta TaxID=301207 RepID=A0ACB6S616_9PLEO|nr:uncharacterized protein BU25DRAFT_457077 [Macroventuria anomochaeta]KAF2629413.1 hypothetical protein BU25DRAFT_457077 [Macroventuria anomochaeta]
MYQILFPNDSEDMIPSPYVDSNWEQGFRLGSNNDELARYEAFLRERLPGAVRMELETLIERDFPYVERIISSTIEIVRKQQLRLFQLYTYSRFEGAEPLNHNTPPVVRALDEQIAQAISRNDIGIGHDAYQPTADPSTAHLLDALAPYNAPPYLSEPFANDFDAVLFDMQDCGRRSSSRFSRLGVWK